MKYNIAQVNVAQMFDTIDSPVMASFVAQLDTINALAEASKGFVWRLKDEGGNATEILVFDDPMIILNMSVWESVEDLRNFAYKSAHTVVMKNRAEWLEKFKTANIALWWIPEGYEPTPQEARAKLEIIDKQGDTQEAFTFKNYFERPSA